MVESRRTGEEEKGEGRGTGRATNGREAQMDCLVASVWKTFWY